MGSKREKRPGVWELRAYIGVVDGKKKWAHETFHGGARAAAKALADLEARTNAGAPTLGGRTTVAQLLDAYVKSRRTHWSPNTARDQPAVIDRWIVPKIGDVDIARIRAIDIERLVDDIAVEHPSTARKVLAILRSAFEDGIRWDLVARNPARSARRPKKPTANTTAPELHLVRAAADAAPPAMAVLVRLATVTGCRRGELLALTWRDIDIDAGTIVVSKALAEGTGKATVKGTKTGRVKVLAIDAGTIAAVKTWRATCVAEALELGIAVRPEHYVFAQRPDGLEPWAPSTLSHRWRKLADAHGLQGVRFHDLRHATATTMIAAGVDPKTAADRLGHDPAVMLGIYTHAIPASDRAVADLLGDAFDRGSAAEA